MCTKYIIHEPTSYPCDTLPEPIASSLQAWKSQLPTWLAMLKHFSDCKVRGANMGPIWGRQDPGGPLVGPWTLLSGLIVLDARSHTYYPVAWIAEGYYLIISQYITLARILGEILIMYITKMCTQSLKLNTKGSLSYKDKSFRDKLICFLWLTHWGRDKMAAFSQTTLSNAFSWMKILEFR